MSAKTDQKIITNNPYIVHLHRVISENEIKLNELDRHKSSWQKIADCYPWRSEEAQSAIDLIEHQKISLRTSIQILQNHLDLAIAESQENLSKEQLEMDESPLLKFLKRMAA